jgi:hypothetical protein
MVQRVSEMLFNVPWSKLKSLRHPKLGRLALLIPIFGYLILFNENIVKYLNLVSSLITKTSYDVGVSPRLLLIYSGLCMISVAVAIYSAFCPSQVTHYGNVSAFAQGDGPGLKDFAFEEIESGLRSSVYIGKGFNSFEIDMSGTQMAAQG